MAIKKRTVVMTGHVGGQGELVLANRARLVELYLLTPVVAAGVITLFVWELVATATSSIGRGSDREPRLMRKPQSAAHA